MYQSKIGGASGLPGDRDAGEGRPPAGPWECRGALLACGSQRVTPMDAFGVRPSLSCVRRAAGEPHAQFTRAMSIHGGRVWNSSRSTEGRVTH